VVTEYPAARGVSRVDTIAQLVVLVVRCATQQCGPVVFAKPSYHDDESTAVVSCIWLHSIQRQRGARSESTSVIPKKDVYVSPGHHRLFGLRTNMKLDFLLFIPKPASSSRGGISCNLSQNTCRNLAGGVWISWQQRVRSSGDGIRDP